MNFTERTNKTQNIFFFISGLLLLCIFFMTYFENELSGASKINISSTINFAKDYLYEVELMTKDKSYEAFLAKTIDDYLYNAIEIYKKEGIEGLKVLYIFKDQAILLFHNNNNEFKEIEYLCKFVHENNGMKQFLEFHKSNIMITAMNGKLEEKIVRKFKQNEKDNPNPENFYETEFHRINRYFFSKTINDFETIKELSDIFYFYFISCHIIDKIVNIDLLISINDKFNEKIQKLKLFENNALYTGILIKLLIDINELEAEYENRQTVLKLG